MKWTDEHTHNVWIQRGELPVLPSLYAIWLVLVSLTSAPCCLSLAAFDYLAVAVPFPSCHYFWQIIIKMTLSQREQLSHGQESTRYTHKRVLLMQNTHGLHTVLAAGWGWTELRGDWLDEMWGLMDIYISLCFYTGHQIMYRSLGDTETYVNLYPLTDMIQFDFNRADPILLRSDTSKRKGTNLIKMFRMTVHMQSCNPVFGCHFGCAEW